MHLAEFLMFLLHIYWIYLKYRWKYACSVNLWHILQPGSDPNCQVEFLMFTLCVYGIYWKYHGQLFLRWTNLCYSIGVMLDNNKTVCPTLSIQNTIEKIYATPLKLCLSINLLTNLCYSLGVIPINDKIMCPLFLPPWKKKKRKNGKCFPPTSHCKLGYFSS